MARQERVDGTQGRVGVLEEHAVTSPRQHFEVGVANALGDLDRLAGWGQHILGSDEHERRCAHCREFGPAIE